MKIPSLECDFKSLRCEYTIVPGKAETVRIGEEFSEKVVKIQRGDSLLGCYLYFDIRDK